MRSFVQILGVVFLSAAFVACFQGAERDKEAPPGLPGGLCLGPDGHCDEGMCNQERNYCFDFADPCKGFFCGGEERGYCSPDGEGQPTCTCEPGYGNSTYALFCQLGDTADGGGMDGGGMDTTAPDMGG